MVVTLVVVLSVLALYFLISAFIANGMAMTSRVSINKTPSTFGLPFQDVSFRSRVDNVLLRGWYIPGGGNGTAIAMHGGKQTRADATMQLLELCVDLAKNGFNILTFDRRGCGMSEASSYSARAHLERDIAGAVDYVSQRKGSQEKVFLLGVSVGAIATLVFAHHEEGISGIVSDSCFAKTSAMAKRVMDQKCKIFGIFAPGAVWMGKILFGLEQDYAINRIASVACPILFISGAEDDVVPAEDTHQLFQASNNPLDELWIAPGASHGQAYSTSPREYIKKVTVFLTSKCIAGEPTPPQPPTS